jgi:hypothetical protein
MRERPRYFPRQLVTPTELNLGSNYLIDRLRRHNRTLHGWGVICGARVRLVPNADATGSLPWNVRITEGVLLDPYGNEVAIETERIVDLRSDGVAVRSGDPSGELDDPWCADAPLQASAGRIWVAVRYEESLARPVRVQPAGCGCDDTACEYSRWCDGYVIGLLDAWPESHQGLPPQLTEVTAGPPIPLADCPADPDDPWVVLASVDFDDDGTVTAIDNCSYRRLVISLAKYWRRCTPTTVSISKVTATPAGHSRTGQAELTVAVEGSGISPEATVDLGPGVRILSREVKSDGTGMSLMVRINKTATRGDRTLTVENPDGSVAKRPKALSVGSGARLTR